jgi:LysR family transcriptional activator of nhaA
VGVTDGEWWSLDPTVKWLNYHHLLYFWMTVKEGGVTAAARKLRLAQPTVSGQLRELESQLGAALFERDGRTLRITPIGRRIFEHADEIFALGDQIMSIAAGGKDEHDVRLVVGCADVMPKLVAYRLIEPALQGPEPPLLVVRQGPVDRMLAELAVGAVDVVLADAPMSPAVRVRGFNHLLGESDVGVFAVEALARRLEKGFPRSLDGAPLLVPGQHTVLRRSIDAWLDANGVAPRIVGEFDDSALLKAFAHGGMGAFFAPMVIREAVASAYGARLVATCTGLHDRYYAISLERRITHPSVAAISAGARAALVARP